MSSGLDDLGFHNGAIDHWKGRNDSISRVFVSSRLRYCIGDLVYRETLDLQSDALKAIMRAYKAFTSLHNRERDEKAPWGKFDKRTLMLQSTVHNRDALNDQVLLSIPACDLDIGVLVGFSVENADEVRFPVPALGSNLANFEGIEPSIIKLGRFITDLDRPWASHNTELVLYHIGSTPLSQNIDFRRFYPTHSIITTFHSEPARVYWSACFVRSPISSHTQEQARIIHQIAERESVYLIVAYITYTNAIINRFMAEHVRLYTLFSPGDDPSMASFQPCHIVLKGERVAAICVRKVTVSSDENSDDMLKYGKLEWAVYWGPFRPSKTKSTESASTLSIEKPIQDTSSVNQNSVSDTQNSRRRKSVAVYVVCDGSGNLPGISKVRQKDILVDAMQGLNWERETHYGTRVGRLLTT